MGFLKNILKGTPKLLLGIGITILGAAITTVPVIAPAGPVIMKVGGTIMVIGAGAKAFRATKEKSVKAETLFKHEKEVIKKLKKNGGHDG